MIDKQAIAGQHASSGTYKTRHAIAYDAPHGNTTLGVAVHTSRAKSYTSAVPALANVHEVPMPTARPLQPHQQLNPGTGIEWGKRTIEHFSDERVLNHGGPITKQEVELILWNDGYIDTYVNPDNHDEHPGQLQMIIELRGRIWRLPHEWRGDDGMLLHIITAIPDSKDERTYGHMMNNPRARYAARHIPI